MSAEMGVFLSYLYQEQSLKDISQQINSFNWDTNQNPWNKCTYSNVFASIFQFPMAQLTAFLLAVCEKPLILVTIQESDEPNRLTKQMVLGCRAHRCCSADSLLSAILRHPSDGSWAYCCCKWAMFSNSSCTSWVAKKILTSGETSMRSPAWWSSAVGIVHSPPGIDLMPKQDITIHHVGHPFASCFDFVTSSSAASTALACCVQRWTTSQVPLTYSGSANGVKQKWSGSVTKEIWKNTHTANMHTQN